MLGTNVEMNGWKYGEYESFVEVLSFDCEGLIFLFDPQGLLNGHQAASTGLALNHFPLFHS